MLSSATKPREQPTGYMQGTSIPFDKAIAQERLKKARAAAAAPGESSTLRKQMTQTGTAALASAAQLVTSSKKRTVWAVEKITGLQILEEAVMEPDFILPDSSKRLYYQKSFTCNMSDEKRNAIDAENNLHLATEEAGEKDNHDDEAAAQKQPEPAGIWHPYTVVQKWIKNSEARKGRSI